MSCKPGRLRCRRSVRMFSCYSRRPRSKACELQARTAALLEKCQDEQLLLEKAKEQGL